MFLKTVHFWSKPVFGLIQACGRRWSKPALFLKRLPVRARKVAGIIWKQMKNAYSKLEDGRLKGTKKEMNPLRSKPVVKSLIKTAERW